MNLVEHTLGARVAKEKRLNEGKATNMRTDDVMARLEQLEMNEGSGAVERSARWRPRHIIWGGWPEGADRTTIERETHELIARLDYSERCLQPFAPRRQGEIAKVHIADSMFGRVHLSMSKDLEERRRHSGGAPS